MPIFKLPNEGDTHTGHITACTTEKGKYGEQVRFVFSNDDVLYVPKVSADRQLLRAGFDGGGTPPTVNYAGVAGNTLVFSRDHNAAAPDKPYWGISIATGAAPAPTKRLAGPTTVPGDTPERYKGKAPAAPDWSEVPTPDAPEPQDYPVRAVAGQPSGNKPSWEALVQQMGTAYAAAYDIQGKRGTADSYQAMCATFIIQADKRGITIPTLTREQVEHELDMTEVPPLPF